MIVDIVLSIAVFGLLCYVTYLHSYVRAVVESHTRTLASLVEIAKHHNNGMNLVIDAIIKANHE